MNRLLLLGVLAAATGCAARKAESIPTPELAAPLQLSPCQVPDVAGEARCGTFTVPEDRRSGGGRTLALKVVVLPALGSERRPDPLFVLAGGPGEAATSMSAFVASGFDRLRQHRDIVLVDQRGTGASNLLQCELGPLDARIKALTTLDIPVDVLRACRAELEKRADLRHYTTPEAMDDLDALRAALGYEQINLYGGSYGTRSAFVYIRQHPEHVRTATLRAIAPVDMKALLPAARHAQRAFDGLVADCAADAACASAYPRLAEQLAQVLERLAAKPVVLRVPNPRTGATEEVQVTRDVFAGALPFLLADPRGASMIPLLIHSAHAGEFAPFAQVVAPMGAGYSDFLSLGMALTVLCSEDGAAIQEDAIRPETAGTFIGDVRVRNQLRACREWPRGEIPAGYYAPLRSEHPVLMISGELDPIDGLDLAQGAAVHLPNARHVIIPRGSHQPQFPGCLNGLMQDFVEAGSARELDFSCVRELRRPAFVIR